ncbi:hypothetical protein TTRE_0000117801 [Trichuris trichiura]|uniref:Uncharacterized protein n=1 Tax=Trichuris trichiura TaxID=36087 RepID=A0A077YYL6_TRITR|nr:hypothetical protein TTRE_0000117801 [Trichuris trichiura]
MSYPMESSGDISEQKVVEFFGCCHNDTGKLSDFLAVVEASCAEDVSVLKWEGLINCLSKMDVECSLPMEHKNKLINLLSQLYASDNDSAQLAEKVLDGLLRSPIFYDGACKVTDLLKITGLLIDAKFSALSHESEITAEINECTATVDILLSLLKLVRLYKIQQDPKNGDFGMKTSYYIQTGWSR